MKKIVLVLLMVLFVLIAGSMSAQSINFGTYPVSVVEKTTEGMSDPFRPDLGQGPIASVVSRSVGSLQIVQVWHISFYVPDNSQEWQCGFVFTISGYDRPMGFLIRMPQVSGSKSGVFIGDSSGHPGVVGYFPGPPYYIFGTYESPNLTDIYSTSNIYGTWMIRGKYVILSGTIMRVFQSVDSGKEFTGFSTISFSAKIPSTSN
jgi:hypothetical protein